jgi:hypothetical protein
MSDEEKSKLRFELANANLQSISHAQGLYVTALLVYICLAWMTVLEPPKEATTIHVLWLDLKLDSIWKITPFVTMVLTLAITGTLNGALSAYTELKAAGQNFFGDDSTTLFYLDTRTNLLDYLALLQVNPKSVTRMPVDSHGSQPPIQRLRHLIFPVLYLGSWFTNGWAVYSIYAISHRVAFLIFGLFCLSVQTLFSIRPVYRFTRRMLGAERTEHVYQ